MAALDLVTDLFARPESQGRSFALVVPQGGEVGLERYGVKPPNEFEVDETPITVDSTLISWSMAKSITHAAVGVLVADGRLDVEAPAAVPEWAGTPKAVITLLELLEMRSGLHFLEDYIDGNTSDCIEMLFGDSGPSHAGYAAGQPLDHEPGTFWNYSSGTTNIICRIIGDVVQGSATGTPGERTASMEGFLSERLFDPIGMDSAEPKFDDAGTFVGSSYVYATALDFAKFGELYRNDGITASGRRILPAGWLDHARTTIATDPETGFGYGRHWWTWPDLPGSLACHGYRGQFTIVVPDRELVLVHLGDTDVSVAPQLRARLRAVIAAT
ncbi:MAG: serine hydrolase [Acidimicrobiia bacterium]|nr:serine hydrolase [Acidimicrobiia bacterium]